MSIPKYIECFSPIMDCISDGKNYTVKEIRELFFKKSNISEEEKQQLLPSGMPIINNRIGWALTYLKKAGLIEYPQRGVCHITNRGKESIKNGTEHITLKYLQQFKEFNDFHTSNKNKEKSENISDIINDESPDEQIQKAISKLNSSLADELMTEITRISPYDFERLVVRLLIKMGYGSPNFNDNAVTKKSGDEGIDGIVTADRFGFDTVYVQAKQWNKDKSVGRPEIQKFLGALAGQGATKGLFITTANFSKEAKEFANKNLQSKIVLVDGDELCNLMIEYDLGVSTVEIYKVKRIDTDYFNDEF
ncbi:MAG: restriction endonuclease [Ruminococcus sp.]|nr:restriction endonuclease [Ruminococcus sp.]